MGLSRLRVNKAISASMGLPKAAADGTTFSLRGVDEINVVAAPAHAATTGWTQRLWIRMEGCDWAPDSADVSPWVVSGSGLAARKQASTQILTYDNPGAVEGYIQLDDATGTTVAIDLQVALTP